MVFRSRLTGGADNRMAVPFSVYRGDKPARSMRQPVCCELREAWDCQLSVD